MIPASNRSRVSRSSDGSWNPGSARKAALLGIVALSVAASAYFTSSSGFYGDDFINFREAQLEHGLSLRFLLSPTSAHFAPGHRLGDWLLYTAAPLNFPVAQVLLLLGFAACLLLFHRVLSELFDPGPALLLTFFYGASTVHVAVHEWWASGLDRVPATLLTFLSILGYLRFHRSGSRRWLAISVGALSIALLFYVKPIFVPLYLVLLRVLLLRPDESVRVSIAAVRREWRVWLLYVVPVALFSVVYLRAYEAGGQVHRPSLAVLGGYLLNLWFRVVAPGTFGLYIRQTDDSTLAMMAFVCGQLVVVAGVVWSFLRRSGAWRAWLFLGITVLANALAVGLTRIGFFAPRYVAYELLYNLEIVYLVIMAVGAAVLGSRRSAAPSAAAYRINWASMGGRALAAAGLASYLALSWSGSQRISQADVWPGPTARAYVSRVDAFLHRSERLGTALALVDGTVPEPVMHPNAGPWTSQSEVFPVVDEDVSFEVEGRPLFEVAGDGTARPVTFVSDAGGGMVDLLRLGVMTFDASKAEVRDGSLCISSGKRSEAVSMAVPAGAGGERPYVLLGHSSQHRRVSALLTEPLGGGPLSAPRWAMLKGDRRQHQNVFTAPIGPLQRLVIVLGPNADLCMNRIEIGRLADRR